MTNVPLGIVANNGTQTLRNTGSCATLRTDPLPTKISFSLLVKIAFLSKPTTLQPTNNSLAVRTLRTTISLGYIHLLRTGIRRFYVALPPKSLKDKFHVMNI